MNILQRKPWRASHGPFQRYDRHLHGNLVIYLAVQATNAVSWLRYAHDCQDPQVACSCAGSYRFPYSTDCPVCNASESSDVIEENGGRCETCRLEDT